MTKEIRQNPTDYYVNVHNGEFPGGRSEVSSRSELPVALAPITDDPELDSARVNATVPSRRVCCSGVARIVVRVRSFTFSPG
jgi:hypothetical protein